MLGSWVSNKICVKEGKIGLGTFATEKISAGEILIVQGGRMIHKTHFDTKEFEPFWYHAFQVEGDVYICPLNTSKEAQDGIFSVNHSCDPTCGFKGQVTMVSMRDIAVGEEITFDYAMSDVQPEDEEWENLTCLCGSDKCRKTVIIGRDWQLPELQKRYAGFFSRYVQDLIDSSHNNH